MSMASIRIITIREDQEFELDDEDTILRVIKEVDGTITLIVLKLVRK